MTLRSLMVLFFYLSLGMHAQSIAPSGASYDGPAEFPRILWCAPGQTRNVTLTNGPATCDYITWAYNNNVAGWPIKRVCSSGTVDGFTCDYTSLHDALAAATSCPLIIRAKHGQSEAANTVGEIHLAALTGCNDSNWVLVMSDDLNTTTGAGTNLPNQGTRVYVGDSPNMWRIDMGACSGIGPGIVANDGAAYYYFAGIEIYEAGCNGTSEGVQLAGSHAGSIGPVTTHHFIFDRILLRTDEIASPANSNMVVGFFSMSPFTSLTDSEILGVHLGGAFSGNEAQAINFGAEVCDPSGVNPIAGGAAGVKCNSPGTASIGYGPFKVVNTTAETAGENIFLGGLGMGPASDVELRKIFMPKRIKWWGGSTPGNCTQLTYTPANCYDGNAFGNSNKNTFEIKTGIRWLLEGSVILNNWQALQSSTFVMEDQPAQDGLRGAMFDGILRFNYSANIDSWIALVTNGYTNSISSTGGWLYWTRYFSDHTHSFVNQRFARLIVHDNLNDIRGGPWVFGNNSSEYSYYPSYPQWYWNVHNTDINHSANSGGTLLDGGPNFPYVNTYDNYGFTTGRGCNVSDNIIGVAGAASFNLSGGGNGHVAFENVCLSSEWNVWNNVAVADTSGVDWENNANQFKPANFAAVSFNNTVDQVNAAGFNNTHYQLTSGSTYHGTAHDCSTGYALPSGGNAVSRTALGYSCDEGADISQLNSHVAGVALLTNGDTLNPNSGHCNGTVSVTAVANALDPGNGTITMTLDPTGTPATATVTSVAINQGTFTMPTHANGTFNVNLSQGRRTITMWQQFTCN